MAGAMRKVGVYLGLVEDADRFDDEYDDTEPEPERRETRPVRAVRAHETEAP
jgi:cell division inhibitor SepF